MQVNEEALVIEVADAGSFHGEVEQHGHQGSAYSEENELIDELKEYKMWNGTDKRAHGPEEIFHVVPFSTGFILLPLYIGK